MDGLLSQAQAFSVITFGTGTTMNLKTYRREGKEALLDACRGKLVRRTPEELVRQALVWRLIAGGVPAELLRTEYHLGPSHGYQGLADIVVLEEDLDRSEAPAALAVIECKEPGQQLLDEKVRQKLFDYADALGAQWALFTNGEEEDEVAFGRDARGVLVEIEAFPSWQKMRKVRPARRTARPAFERWDFEDIACPCRAQEALESAELDIVGEGSPRLMATVAANLFGFLADDRLGSRARRKRRGGIQLCQDLGRKTREVRISPGGRWPSRYWRSFLVRHGGEYSTVSLALFAQAKTVGDPLYGNVRGSTVLVAVVDSLKKSQIAFELSLDKALQLRNGRFELVHDGLMTIGPLGRVQLDKVFAQVQRHAPDLVGEGQIVLGSFPTDENCSWRNAGTLVLNLLRYAVLRDELKRTVSAAKALSSA